jgi:hypothetical protein
MVSISSFCIEVKILYFLERADEERREKEAKIKLKKKQFRDLLKESNVSMK